MRSLASFPTQARRFLLDEQGPSAVEYAVLLGLIVLTAAGAIRAIGESMHGLWVTIHSAVNTTG